VIPETEVLQHDVCNNFRGPNDLLFLHRVCIPPGVEHLDYNCRRMQGLTTVANKNTILKTHLGRREPKHWGAHVLYVSKPKRSKLVGLDVWLLDQALRLS